MLGVGASLRGVGSSTLNSLIYHELLPTFYTNCSARPLFGQLSRRTLAENEAGVSIVTDFSVGFDFDL